MSKWIFYPERRMITKEVQDPDNWKRTLEYKVADTYSETDAKMLLAAPELLQIVADLHRAWPQFDDPDEPIEGSALIAWLAVRWPEIKRALNKAGVL